MLQKDPKVISRSIKAEAGETTQPSSAPAAFLLGKGRCPWRREVSGGQTRAHITQGALETDYLLSGGQPGRGPRLGGGGEIRFTTKSGLELGNLSCGYLAVSSYTVTSGKSLSL